MRVVITIEGAQADVLEQEPDEQVQFSTDGEYTCVDGCGMLTYPESELTGMAGTLTTITFTPSNAVLKRTGAVTSRMVFAPGTRNTFLYQTPYGTSTVGLETQRYRSTLGERGGGLPGHDAPCVRRRVCDRIFRSDRGARALCAP